MSFDDEAIARSLNRKYPEIKTGADARRIRDQAILKLRKELLRKGHADLAALPEPQLFRLIAEASKLPS